MLGSRFSQEKRGKMNVNQEFKKRLKSFIGQKSRRKKIGGYYVLGCSVKSDQVDIDFWWPRWYLRTRKLLRRNLASNPRITFFYLVGTNEYFRTYEVVDGKLLQFSGQVANDRVTAPVTWFSYSTTVSGWSETLDDYSPETWNNILRVEKNLFDQCVAQPEEVKVDLFDYLDSIQASLQKA